MKRTLTLLILGYLSLAARPSGAEPALPAQADVATHTARRLHLEGDALYEKGKIADAHAAYVAAWSLKKHYQIAGSLGDCEMRLGKYRDAAEHLAYFLRGYPKDQPVELRERARGMLEEAKRHIAALTIDVGEAGVDILVDGKLVGQSPLEGPVFVEPGSRLIEARRGTESGWKTIDARAGQAADVVLVLSGARRIDVASSNAQDRGRDWVLVLGSAVVGAAGLGAGAWMMTRAHQTDVEMDKVREGTGMTPTSACHGSADVVKPECGPLRELGTTKDAYAVGSAVAFGLSVAGVFLTLRSLAPSTRAERKRGGISLQLLPGPYFQLGGKF